MHLTKKSSYLITVIIFLLFISTGIYFFQSKRNSQNSISIPNTTTTQESLTTVHENKTTESTKINSNQSETLTQIPPEGDTNGDSQFLLSDFHRSETKDGEILWEIKGKNARYNPTKQGVDIEDCLFSMRSEEENKLITLQAGEAKVILNGANFEVANFSKSVTLNYGSEVKIITEQADYDKKNGTISSKSHVQIIGEWYTIEGVGLSANLNSKTYKILKDVKTTLTPQKKAEKRVDKNITDKVKQ